MLQDLERVPGIEGHHRLQYRRQIFGLAQHGPPFLEPRILVPVEIVDKWITIPRPICRCDRLLQHRFGARQDRIDGGQLGVECAGAVTDVLPLPFSNQIGLQRGGFALDAAVTKRCSRPSLPGNDVVAAQAAETVQGERPSSLRLGTGMGPAMRFIGTPPTARKRSSG